MFPYAPTAKEQGISRQADPMKIKDLLWPNVVFYKEQIEIIYSVWDNDETFVIAGNKLGKDYVGAFICLVFYLTRWPCRIITTSAKDDHLRVLWGEIGNFVQTSTIPLDHKRGGPLIMNHQDYKKIGNDGQVCKLSYMKGLVASADSLAAMQGHHIAKTGDGIPRTLFVSDESSSVPDEYYRMAKSWANRAYIFGNPWDCQNFFRKAVDGDSTTGDPGGDIKRENGIGYERKVYELGVECSPNIKYARWEQSQGRIPSNRIIVPGVKDWEEYCSNLRRWDKIQQCVSLYGKFYKGSELLLFPPDWLAHSEKLAENMRGKRRYAKAIGIDPAEGGDKSSWAAVDDLGLIEQVSFKTPNTSDVYYKTIEFGLKHNVDPSNWVFDRGGGGKQHADRLREKGYDVRSVGFGESPTNDPQIVPVSIGGKIHAKESRHAYMNRRAEMYGQLSLRMDPFGEYGGFALPPICSEVKRQLSPIPKKYEEGRLRLPPKHRTGARMKNGEKSLSEILGCSPDEADSVVLAVWGMENPEEIIEIGGYG